MSPRTLIIEADGGSRGNPGPAGYGAVVVDGATGELLAERAGYLGHATNNVAEYRGVIAGLEAARAIDPEAHLEARLDSKLVVEQMSGRWKIKHADMKPLAHRAREIVGDTPIVYVWVPRADNARADALANEAMDTKHKDIRRDFDGASEEADTPGNRRNALFTVKGSDLVSPLTLVLVRHGVTEMTVSGQLSGSGQEGPSLTAAGKVQVAKAADAVYRIGRRTWERVPRVSRVIASPLVRTQETGTALGRRLGAHVETEPRIREIDFGEWEGRTVDELSQSYGDAIHRWRFGEYAPPGGEAIPEVGQRMNAAFEDLAAEHARRCVDGDDHDRAYALATHAVAIKAAVGHSLGLDTRQWGSLWPQPASMTIIQLRVTGDGEIAERHLLCLGAPVD